MMLKYIPNYFQLKLILFFNNATILKMGEYKFDENLVEVYWNEKMYIRKLI